MRVEEVIKGAESRLKPLFEKIEDTALFNQEKVLKAFFEERIAMRHFMQSNGYGYAR